MILLCLVGLAIGASTATWAAFSASTQSSGNTFSAASSFCLGSALNPFWLSGFEEGINPAQPLYDAALAASADSAVKRSGSYSARLDVASGASGYIAKAAVSATVTLRLAMRFASLPASDVTSVIGATANTGSSLALGYRASDQKLTLRWGTATQEVSSTAISAGTWYVLDLRVSAGANPRTADWRIDGVTQPAASSAEAGGLVAYIGPGTTTATDVFSANFDDIIATTSGADYPIGAGSVLPLQVDGVGTHNNSGNFADDDGTAIDANSWTRIDEVPISSTADHVRQTSASSTSYLDFSFANPSGSCIKAVNAILGYTSAGNPSNNGRTSIYTDTTERVVYSGDMSETSLSYRTATIAPSGASWTQAQVDALTARIGYSTDVNPVPQWESLMLVYESQ